MYHFLRGINHLKCQEIPMQIKPAHTHDPVKWAVCYQQPTLLLYAWLGPKEVVNSGYAFTSFL